MKTFWGSICKEDLLEIIEKADWGKPTGRGKKHYLPVFVNVDITVTAPELFDCSVLLGQSKKNVEMGERPVVIFGARSKFWRDEYFRQRDAYNDEKNAMPKYKKINEIYNKKKIDEDDSKF